jgi:hypothetical protein
VKRLVVESWLLLLYFDCLMHLMSFGRARTAVRSQMLRRHCAPKHAAAGLCHAIDLACVFYFKRVQCLQRSAATAVLLRRYGWQGEMVIGATVIPFQSHAWVEIDGVVVNDKPYMAEMFAVLERC